MDRADAVRLVVDEHTKGGFFSSVFMDYPNGVAHKLFKGHCHPSISREGRQVRDGVRRLVFQDEIKAYEIASRSPILRRYVPEFFGVVRVDGVSDASGNDLSHLYLLDCCYSMELIEGDAIDFDPSKPDVDEIVREFAAEGIEILGDSSCFVDDGPPRMKIIDFRTRDILFEDDASNSPSALHERPD